jgi:hypothetical protein
MSVDGASNQSSLHQTLYKISRSFFGAQDANITAKVGTEGADGIFLFWNVFKGCKYLGHFCTDLHSS